ncbi:MULTISPECIES: hypothetical protein [Sporosarcina]|uniref:Uncharacterized protein n=1 Tax=Sporosarcina contaminans TaxID=633403 RepID=A0ABW3TYK5_9BACL
MVDEMISYELVPANEAKELLTDQEVQGIVMLEKGIAEKHRNGEIAVYFQPSPGMPTAPLIEQQVIQILNSINIYAAAVKVGSDYLNEQWETVYSKLTENEGLLPAWTEQRSINFAGNSMIGVSYSSTGFSIIPVSQLVDKRSHTALLVSLVPS